MRITLAVVAVLAVLLCVGTLWLGSFTVTGKRQTLDEAFAWQSERYDTSFYGRIEKEDYVVAGRDGYELHAQLLRNPEPTSRYVIISHGYTDNRMGALKYVPLYLELGYNCIVYDLRGHGLNDPTFTTYGLYEGEDLACLVADARERFDVAELGLHGESLGAASTLSALAYDPDVDFAVSDCAFADIENVLRGGYASVGLPSWLFNLANLGVQLRYYVSLTDMRPIDALEKSTVPLLVLHGADDTFILPANADRIHAAAQGPSELHLIPGAAHAESILVAPDEYCTYVEAFLQGISDSST